MTPGAPLPMPPRSMIRTTDHQCLPTACAAGVCVVMPRHSCGVFATSTDHLDTAQRTSVICRTPARSIAVHGRAQQTKIAPIPTRHVQTSLQGDGLTHDLDGHRDEWGNMTTRNTFAAALAVLAGLAAESAAAGSADDLTARIDALERQNAAIRRENEVLRENKRLLEQNAKLKSETGSSAAKSSRASAAAQPVVLPSRSETSVFDAYAADLAVKAPPRAAPAQFRAWVEGGAIWSGGDPVSSSYTNLSSIAASSGVFDLTPKVGWEAAIGFDHRFANSPWHVSGQFRYGEAKAKGTNASSLSGTGAGGSQTLTQINDVNYRETRWLADLAVGRDIFGSGPGALQLKGGVRVSEFSTRLFDNSTLNQTVSLNAPIVLIPGYPALSNYSTTTANLFDSSVSFLGAGPLVGVEGSVPFAGRWSFDYAADAAFLLGRQQNTGTGTTVTSIVPAIIPTNTDASSSTTRQFAGVLSADIQAGVSYWLTQNVKLGASYRLDALINVFNESGKANNGYTPDRYTHGPRVTLTGQFDAQ